ncbi:hypothetical protein TorRG33x02_125190 [Trema orientale]|uniref:Uncharacterized protein n=1 Tax=Trema orientale TaxID=63057 RepID=A0A2P5F1M4_TREOI|nr:hypothetical protein TorRG33x02_125190 [Trema orientale]
MPGRHVDFAGLSYGNAWGGGCGCRRFIMAVSACGVVARGGRGGMGFMALGSTVGQWASERLVKFHKKCLPSLGLLKLPLLSSLLILRMYQGCGCGHGNGHGRVVISAALGSLLLVEPGVEALHSSAEV